MTDAQRTVGPKTARSAGICYKCGESFNAGDGVYWYRDVKGSRFHAACLSATDPDSPPIEAIPFDALPTSPTISPPTIPDKKTNGLAESLAVAVAPYLVETLKSKVDEGKVLEIVETALGKRVVTLKVESLDGEVKEIDSPHKLLPKLLYLIGKSHHVYLWGPPGSGKSTAAHQVADALDREYGYISLNPQTPDSRVLGYMDATGNYRETVFHRLYKDGGVFCIDELDNAAPSLLTTLNSCLENSLAAFPNGMVTRHPKFICVGTGNTNGRGASSQFPDRRPFDAAFAERFSFLAWGHDEILERTIALGINPEGGAWIDWVQKVRKFAGEKYPRLIVSPRASFRGVAYQDSGWDAAEIAEVVLFKGLDTDTVRTILSANPFPRVAQ